MTRAKNAERDFAAAAARDDLTKSGAVTRLHTRPRRSLPSINVPARKARTTQDPAAPNQHQPTATIGLQAPPASLTQADMHHQASATKAGNT